MDCGLRWSEAASNWCCVQVRFLFQVELTKPETLLNRWISKINVWIYYFIFVYLRVFILFLYCLRFIWRTEWMLRQQVCHGFEGLSSLLREYKRILFWELQKYSLLLGSANKSSPVGKCKQREIKKIVEFHFRSAKKSLYLGGKIFLHLGAQKSLHAWWHKIF